MEMFTKLRASSVMFSFSTKNAWAALCVLHEIVLLFSTGHFFSFFDHSFRPFPKMRAYNISKNFEKIFWKNFWKLQSFCRLRRKRSYLWINQIFARPHSVTTKVPIRATNANIWNRIFSIFLLGFFQ